jgi:uncharacterized protein (TIGR03000 family)
MPPSLGDDRPSLLATSAPEVTAGNRSAAIGVLVPDAEAEVRLNGQPIPGTGTERLLVTPVLEPNRSYQYQVAVTWKKDGQLATDVREITLGAGEFVLLDFRPRATTGLAEVR